MDLNAQTQLLLNEYPMGLQPDQYAEALTRLDSTGRAIEVLIAKGVLRPRQITAPEAVKLKDVSQEAQKVYAALRAHESHELTMATLGRLTRLTNIGLSMALKDLAKAGVRFSKEKRTTDRGGRPAVYVRLLMAS
jgi:hypothetical protein